MTEIMDRILNDRVEFADLCNDMGLTKAVEVGTHQGVFADGFMSRFNGHLTCVDSWVDDSPPPHKTFLPYFVETSPSREFDEALARFVLSFKYGLRVAVHKMESTKYAETIEDRSLDFVYLDGSHKLPHVKADLLAYWPKLKPGGVMAGHDYVFGDPRGVADITLLSVAVAVNWFAAEHGLDLKVTNEALPSWYFRKP